MKKGIMILMVLVFTLFPLGAAMSQTAGAPSTHDSHHPGVKQATDRGNALCMAASPMMGESMMSDEMMQGMHNAGETKGSPNCGMMPSECTANYQAGCDHDMAHEARMNECGV